MNPFSPLHENFEEIRKDSSIPIKNVELLKRAFTHSSFVNEYRGSGYEHNERLEFLGDSVLNLIVADFLYKAFTNIPEGTLSSLRSHIVSATSCALFVTKLDVGSFLLLGKGEMRHGLPTRSSAFADLFEAILGAIYLDGGFQAAHSFFMFHFASLVNAQAIQPEQNWKALLQELLQKGGRPVPKYVVIKEAGPDHSKQFTVVSSSTIPCLLKA